ncbi:hypothetical protein DXT76_11400 [Halobacillus trueperi]|uniref:Uncharacterized protein n=1 Tax=Halobacillus trueperi TaxID=156205 RepID=A0A3D8VNJ3_9BACI|nr:hypothetical protein DXT76_11400 [Halobacillus trueperi]
MKASNYGSSFETLVWQRGGGEWRDSCGEKVLGETPQDAVRGVSPRSRGKRAIPRSPIDWYCQKYRYGFCIEG